MSVRSWVAQFPIFANVWFDFMRTGSKVLLLSFLALACGKTRTDEPGGHPHGDESNTGGAAPTEVGSAGRDGAAGSAIGGRGSSGDLSYVDLTGAAIFTRVQRLTNSQWENAVTDILRLPKPPGLAANFSPPLSGVTTFDNNEQVLFVDQQRFSDFESGTEAVAALATGSPEALAALYSGDDAAGLVRALGRRAFRRPLTGNEETKYQNVFALGERLYGAGFANGAALVIRAMLQSPHFLYRTELGPAGNPLSSFELASKLSFWLLGTTPSDALLDAAASDRFASSDQLVETARQMLEDPRARAVMRDFHGQLLHVASLQNISKPGVPEFDPALDPELVLASNAFFDLLLEENYGLRELLTSHRAYVGPRLAPFYGVAAPSAGLELRDVGPSRSGYFMQVPFLMHWSNNAEPDPIRRGLELEAAILCGPARTPPAEVPVLPPAVSGQTNRQRVAQFNTQCGGSCHGYIDPLGFALENFDGLGRKRELDNGLAIDTTGTYPLAEGIEPFRDGTDLMRVLANSAQAHTCYSKHVVSYALGRDMMESDRPLLDSLSKVSQTQSLKELVVALVRDPAFRMRRDGQP